MKIATRTALTYTVFTAAILFLFGAVIIFVSTKNQKDEFFDRLGYKLIWRAEFFFDAGVDEEIIRLLHKRNQKLLNEADVSIYDQDKNLLFADAAAPIASPWVWRKLQKSNKVQWIKEEAQYMAMPYVHKNKTYYIYGKAKDITGVFYMKRLQQSILIIYGVSLVLIFVVGFWFSNYTLRPIKQIISHIRTISEHQLDRRLNIPKAKDELYELTQTFNSTFNRLEISFNNHKNFVTTISHEFRTPLASLIAELQLANELNKTVSDYKLSIDNALLEAQKATDLSSALLDLARASYDVSQIQFVPLRLDEVLIEAKLKVVSENENYTVRVGYGDNILDDDMELLEFFGNPYLLDVAFINLIENACKYSEDQTCDVDLISDHEKLIIRFTDHGVGISEVDQPKIFDLFYRGENKGFNDGNGIGLSIVSQIIKLHHGTISLTSEKGVGSIFTLSFPKK